jgi:hypothetical protein
MHNQLHTPRVFFSKTRKISILNEIKSFEEFNIDSNVIKFPKHHKQNQDNSFPSTLTNFHHITLDQMEKSIYDAYEYAKSLTEKLGMSTLLKKKNVFKLNDLCASMRDDLKKMVYITDQSEFDDDDYNDDDENIEHLLEGTTTDSTTLNNNSDSEDECVGLGNACTLSKKDSYNGMRIYSAVADEHKKTFFKININGNNKYMHKQTAAWFSTKKITVCLLID